MSDILNALNGRNGLIVAILLIIVIALIFVSAKLGIIKIKTDKLMVGTNMSDQERAIIRNQIEWIRTACFAFEKQLPNYENLDHFRAKFILELMVDEITNWIIFNHIEDKEVYIENKQEKIWAIAQGNTDRKEFRTNKFRKQCDDYVENVIKRLISIREEYD